MDLQEARQSLGRIRGSAVEDGDYFPFAGGLNNVETPMQLRPGELLAVSNYECKTLGGYERLQGYERLDGQPFSSVTPYYILRFTAGFPPNYPIGGATINGGISGAVGVMLAEPVINDDGVSGYVVIYQTYAPFANPAFQAGEPLTYGGNVFGTNAAAAIAGAAATGDLDATYLLAAQQYHRSLIQRVPGQGPIRGVVEYRGNIYAWRDNIGATAIVMWKATTSSWQQIPSYPQLRFTAGSIEIVPGNSVVGGTSAAAATVARVVLQSGSWNAGTAQGFLILNTGIYGFINAEALKVGGVTQATTSGVSTIPALAAGGQFEFRVHNFYGNSGTIRLYGVDGANRAFEYQDSFGGILPFYCPIESGMTVDKPTHLAVHRGRLWLAFLGGSAQPSGVADPVTYSALTGAAELGVGQDITGFLEEMSPSQSAFYSTATLFVFCQNEIHQITGDGPNWVLGPYAVDIGANPYTMQRMGQGIFLSDRGFSALQSVSALGNFALATFSQKIQKLIASIVSRVVCSGVSKNRSLYRAFLSDGTFVSIGFKDLKVTGHTLCDLGQVMSCSWVGEDTSKKELLLLGGHSGYVYRMDSGNNIDGNTLNAFIFPAFHFSKSPSRVKRYRRAQLDVLTDGPTSLTISPNYSFGDQFQGADLPRLIQVLTTAARYDSASWDLFTWDSTTSSAPTVKLEASGRSIATILSHSSINDKPHTIQGLSLQKSTRRLDRSSQA